MALRKQQAVFMLCWKVTTLRSLFIPIFNVVITLLNSIPLLVKLAYLECRLEVPKIGSFKVVIKGYFVILLNAITFQLHHAKIYNRRDIVSTTCFFK